MGKDRYQGKWSFGLLWIIVNTLSWGIYIVVGIAAGWVVWQAYQDLSRGQGIPFLANESNRYLIVVIIFGVCGGAIIGSLQHLVLKPRFHLEGKKWVSATIIGITVYTVITILVSPFVVNTFVASIRLPVDSLHVIYSIISMFTSLIAFAALGIAQWFVLRQHFTKSGWWIVATVIASGFSTFVTSTFARGGDGSSLLYSIVYYSVEGLIYGLATLIALAIISSNQVRMIEEE